MNEQRDSAGDDPIRRRRACMLRPWRWALAFFALALTTATHWPRLRLSPEIPASDKTIHMLAFAGLTLLIWRSGLIGPRWLVALVALGWSILDEVSQAIPILQRTVSWHDAIANACGVVCAAALLWALRPLRRDESLTGPNLQRARLFEFTFDEMFSRAKPWLIGGATVLVSAGAIAVARPWLASPRTVGIFGLVVALVAIHVLYLIYRAIFFREMARVRSEQPCLSCGAPSDRASESRAGDAACGACGRLSSASAYVLPPRPSAAMILRITAMPALLGLAGVAGLFAIVLVLPLLYGWAIAPPARGGFLPRLAHAFGRLPPQLTSVVDLTAYALLLAIAVRSWRRRYAAYVDRAVRCRRCGHDLHGTPVNERGEGQCGECGATFERKATAA